MGKKSASPPAAPNPAQTAAAQAAANKEAAIAQGQMNMVNQETPYGSLEFTERGKTEEGTPQYTATQTLAPDQQRMLDLTNQAGIQFGETANQQLSSLGGVLGSPIDLSTLGAAPEVNEATRQSVVDSMLERAAPRFAKDRELLETSLANKGIGMGSDAYNDALDELNRSRNDYRLAADIQAGGEMSRLYGLESSARDRAINEMIMPRTQGLNELAAMLSGTQVQGPSFVQTPQTGMAAPDVMGATYGAYNGAMDAYGSQMRQNNAMMGGLFGLGSAGLGAGLMPGGFLL